MASQLSDRHFYETLYECHCFGFIVSDEQCECKSKFTIDNIFNSINKIPVWSGASVHESYRDSVPFITLTKQL